MRSVDSRERQACPECGFVIYEHSRPCAGALVVDKGRVLLVKRAAEPFKGYWDIPGGFLEAGEHPADGAARELSEETGLEIEPLGIIGIFVDEYGPERIPTLNIVYHARTKSRAARPGSDATEVRWFPIADIPDEIAFDWSREAILMLRGVLNTDTAPR